MLLRDRVILPVPDGVMVGVEHVVGVADGVTAGDCVGVPVGVAGAGVGGGDGALVGVPVVDMDGVGVEVSVKGLGVFVVV